ncbi:hypothetical protein LCGC14_2485450, partial [marine sediment metagenome]
MTNLVLNANVFDRKRPGTDAGEGTEDGQGLKLHCDEDPLIEVTITNNLFVCGACVLAGGLNNAIINI